ncbi:MAG: hypothetical protein HY078_07035 [Elusimicrobia bacterium]|nr:hypothetical protein [Elusimicrobiota bacterium]
MDTHSTDKSTDRKSAVGVNRKINSDANSPIDWRSTPVVLAALFLCGLGFAAHRVSNWRNADQTAKPSAFAAKRAADTTTPAHDLGDTRAIGSAAVESYNNGDGPTDANGEMIVKDNATTSAIGELNLPVQDMEQLTRLSKPGNKYSNSARGDIASAAPLLTHPTKIYDNGNPGGFKSQAPRMPAEMNAHINRYGGPKAALLALATGRFSGGGSATTGGASNIAGAGGAGKGAMGYTPAGDRLKLEKTKMVALTTEIPLLPPEAPPFPKIATCKTEYGDIPCKIPKNAKYGDIVTDLDGLPLDGVMDGKYFDSDTELPPICRIAHVGRGRHGAEHTVGYDYPWIGASDQTACGAGEGCRLDASQPPTYWHNGSMIQCVSPIVFDLAGRGIDTVDRWASYDLAGDGSAQQMHDLGKGVGLLVFDWNRSGKSGADGRGLFGTQTSLSGSGKPDGFRNGFEALTALARKAQADGVLSHGRSVLDSADLRKLEAAYGLRMRIGGLRGKDVSMEQAGIRSLRLSKAADRARDNFDGRGDSVLERPGATFTRTDGTQGTYADVFFRVVRPQVTAMGRPDQRVFRWWPGPALFPTAMWLRR